MKRTGIFILSFIFISVSTISCKQNNRFRIDLKENFVDVTIKRFDKDIISLDTMNMQGEVERLYQEYPDFFPVFIANILDVEPADTALVADFIQQFLADTAFLSVNQTVLKQFDDIQSIERSISTAYSYIQYYFPGMTLPDVYFFVSGFNLSIMMTEKAVGMGTDLYLGADFPAYREITYQYMLANMKRENIAPDLISALLFREFRMDSDKDRLIDEMLYRGKVMYLLSTFMPDEKDENLMGYTKEQIDWCKKNERKIWAAIIDQKHLFSSDSFTIRKYINEAPFTSTVSTDSPGRAGTWIGWQIVRSYMQRNTDQSLTDLMRENNYQKMLEESGYRP